MADDEKKRTQAYMDLDSRKSKRIQDSVNGQYYREESMMQCPWPAMIKKYGHASGKVFFHHTRCKKCRYAKTYRYFGGIKCEYEEQNK